ncbi:MAG: hypothetical protein ACP5FT_01415 [Acidilobus sp.]
MDRDDASTWAASLLGGLGAVLLFSGALMSAGGGQYGKYVTAVGLILLLSFVVLIALLLIPWHREGAAR